MEKLTNIGRTIGINNYNTSEHKNPEWVFQFNNDEPIVLIKSTGPDYKKLTIVVESTSNIVFRDGKGNEFKIFAREQAK